MESLKGVLVFYVSHAIGALIDYKKIIELAIENHTDAIDSMRSQGWETMFVPCVGEASHTSKVELEGTGCIIVYININSKDSIDGINVSSLIDSAKEGHIELIQRVREKGWELIFMPCTGEGGRVEKINLNENEVSNCDN